MRNVSRGLLAGALLALTARGQTAAYRAPRTPDGKPEH